MLDCHLLGEFTNALVAAEDRKSVLAACSTWLPALLDAEMVGTIALADGGDTTPQPIGGQPSRDLVHLTPGSFLSPVVNGSQAVVVDDLTVAEGPEEMLLREAGLLSCLVAPLTGPDGCLGVLSLFSCRRAFFTLEIQKAVKVLTQIAGSFLHLHDVVEMARNNDGVDSLTGVLSRRAILDRLNRAFVPGGSAPAVIVIDLDGFSTTSRVHGNDVGDQLLRHLASRIQTVTGESETVGRLADDQFLVVVQTSSGSLTDRAARLGADLSTQCSRPFLIDDVSVQLVPRIAVAARDPEALTTDHLCTVAEVALEAARSSGRTLVVADDSHRLDAARRITIDHELDAAMDHGDLCFNYEPICHLRTGEVVVVECLLRWNHPTYGWISPPEIIERVEATGRTNRFTEWTLRTAARDLRVARERVPSMADVRFTVNLTQHQLAWEPYAETHLATCRHYGLEPYDLAIEVVESAGITPGDPAEVTLNRMAEANGSIVLDDFGTGHHVLDYFTRFTIHALKLDRHLVSAVVADGNADKVLRNLVRMCEELGIHFVAEGIETEAELQACLGAGVQHGQGWLLSRSLSLDELLDWVASRHRQGIS